MRVSTGNYDTARNYHTVEVSKNLPKVETEDLPPANYWMNWIKFAGVEKYNGIQHIMVNYPCESFKK